jgi:hypothetical protein
MPMIVGHQRKAIAWQRQSRTPRSTSVAGNRSRDECHGDYLGGERRQQRERSEQVGAQRRIEKGRPFGERS